MCKEAEDATDEVNRFLSRHMPGPNPTRDGRIRLYSWPSAHPSPNRQIQANRYNLLPTSGRRNVHQSRSRSRQSLNLRTIGIITLSSQHRILQMSDSCSWTRNPNALEGIVSLRMPVGGLTPRVKHTEEGGLAQASYLQPAKAIYAR